MDNLPIPRKAYTDREGQVWESRVGDVWLVLETVARVTAGICF